MRPRFVFTVLFYIVTGGHISLLEQRHHQFISFNPLIFTNLLSMAGLIEDFKINVKKNLILREKYGPVRLAVSSFVEL